MEGIGEAIKYLYQEFILRDVVAYVTPGTILSVCVLKIYFGTLSAVLVFINEIPKLAYIPIYGFLFITGLAIENLGEVLHVLREHERGDNDRFAKLQEFHRVTSREIAGDEKNAYGGSLERTRERISVKKYASGHIAMALIISAILIGVETKISPYAARWAIWSVGAILVACLILAHHRQLHFLRIWEDEATDDPGKSKERDQGSIRRAENRNSS